MVRCIHWSHISGRESNDVRVRRPARWMKSVGWDVEIWTGRMDLKTAVGVPCAQYDGCVYRQIGREDSNLIEELIRTNPPDLIYFHEANSLSDAGWEDLKKQHPEIKFVYDAHEFEPGRALNNSTAVIERDRMHLIDAMLCEAPHIGYPYWALYQKMPYITPNSPYTPTRPWRKGALERYAEKCGIEFKRKGPIVVCSGLTHKVRMSHQFAEAIKTLGWTGVSVGQVRGPELQKQFEEAEIVCLPSMPYPYEYPDNDDCLLDVLADCDIGFYGVDLEWLSYQVTVPNKFFEYAFAGLPIVATASHSMQDMWWRYGTGLHLYDNTVSSLMIQLNHALEDKECGRVDNARLIEDWAFDWYGHWELRRMAKDLGLSV